MDYIYICSRVSLLRLCFSCPGPVAFNSDGSVRHSRTKEEVRTYYRNLFGSMIFNPSPEEQEVRQILMRL